MATVDLHLASGDHRADMLRRAGCLHVLAWREALADGPITARRDDLLALRRQFVTQAYSSSAEQYDAMVATVLTDVREGSYQHIMLHFDNDLFCVTNALFCISQLSNVATVSWTTPQGVIELTTLDRAFASSCWRALADTTPLGLIDLLPQLPQQLQFLRPALVAHLQRFPARDTGFGKPQEIIRDLLDRGLEEEADIINGFIALDANTYGWGDVQILRELRITRAMLRGEDVRLSIGGVTLHTKHPTWVWDVRRNTVCPIE
jgi:hypothetical protein